VISPLTYFHVPASGPTEEATDRNTLVFRISLACTHKPASTLPRATPDNANTASLFDPSSLYENHEVLSSHLVWDARGEQSTVFDQCPAPTNGNIVLAKLRPGQEVDLECHAVKGTGQDHSKFSPVGESFNLPLANSSPINCQQRPPIVSFPQSPSIRPIQSHRNTPINSQHVFQKESSPLTQPRNLFPSMNVKCGEIPSHGKCFDIRSSNTALSWEEFGITFFVRSQLSISQLTF
jgi:hypothetical protein